MHVEHGADQELRPDRAAAPLLADPCREPGPGGIAADPEPGRINPERVCLCGDPIHRRQRVVEGGRERVFGREPVIDRDDAQGAGLGQHPAESVMGVEAAGHEAAAV